MTVQDPDYEEAIEFWSSLCNCGCPGCHPYPCEGSMQGGMCDGKACTCDEQDAEDNDCWDDRE